MIKCHREVRMEKKDNSAKILVCLYIIIGLLALNTLVVILSNASNESPTTGNTEETKENTEYDISMFNEITTDDLSKVASSSEPQVIYIGRSTCGYCVAFLPTLQKAQSEYGYTTQYLDITKITTEEQQNALLAYDNDSKILSDNFGSTPMVLIVKDGKLVNGTVGYEEYDTFADFLEENGISK